MNWEAIGVIASIVFALVSGAGAFVAWARANISKQAKADAEDARDAAKRHLEAAEETAVATARQAEQLQGIADLMRQSTTPPPLSLSYVRGALYRLTNNTNNYIHIEDVENRDRFAIIELGPDTTVEASQAVEFRLSGAGGLPLPPQMILTIMNADDSLVVPVPPKP